MHGFQQQLSWCRSLLGGAAFSLAVLAAPVCGHAQTATITGNLGGFDVVNDTGQEAHGFEIQIEGITRNDLYYTGFGQRYGQGVVESYATGVYIRWLSPYDPGSQHFTATTPQYTSGTPISWNDCYSAGSRYGVSGCEHFGQSMRATNNIVSVTYRWLVADPSNPGNLIALGRPAAIVAPIAVVVPPVQVSSPPIVVAEVEAPEPPEAPEKFGDAQWMKVYKTQLTREVTLDELTSTNTTIVPEDPTQIEVAWDILQVQPPSNGNQKRTRKQNQGNLSPDTRSVVRRYELYKYTGTYDATTHEAICADGNLCNAPSPGELGDFISAQNSAINVSPDVISVTRTGNGSVSGVNGKLSCGNACSVFAPNGSTQTLTANPGGLVFTGWGGACSGTALTCSVVVNGPMQVSASFLPQFTLSVGRSNPGTIVGTPNGNDRQLNCGGNCSAKFTSGTVVTLTATPPTGKQFVNWSGACSGTAPTCLVSISKDTSVQAVFSK